eukprot:jgi/Botrbrau1/21958/Bobra.0249s0081.1
MFRITARDGCARTGILTLRGQEFQTPAVLLYTRRGGPLNLTPDLVEELGPDAASYHLDATQFLENPDPETLQKFGKGGHAFLAAQDKVLVATTRDATSYAYPKWRTVNAKGVRVEVSGGLTELSPEKYAAIIEALRPDLYSSLADEIAWDASRKRAVAAVNRTLKWLDDLLNRPRGAGHSEEPSPVLAPITGASFLEERRRSAAESAARPVSGFVLSGFGTGESWEQRLEHLQVAVKELPDGLPRLLVGPSGSPDEVLAAVSCGVDIFDTAYAALATQAGYALTFPIDEVAGPTDCPEASASDCPGSTAIEGPADQRRSGEDGEQDGEAAGVMLGSDDTKINIWAEGYRRDPGPLLVGCQCFTCRKHSRAYVHHLLMSHEMLAQVLLELHNTHHMLRFFRVIKDAIRVGQLASLQRRLSALKPS